MSSVYLTIGLCVLGVGMFLAPGWLALFWLAACSGVAAIVPTILDEVRWKKRQSTAAQIPGRDAT